jgi:tRNA pseudouridine38-40 synthase
MDVETLQTSARIFEGEHNFLSFAATDPDLARRGASPVLDSNQEAMPPAAAVRTIFSSTWEQQTTEVGGLLIYRVRGSGFLHHMVRNLVGTMLDVGRGHLELTQLPSILAARSRAAAGPTAPASGLFLHSVEYDEAELVPEPE